MAADSMDIDMDIDLTLDPSADVDQEVARLHREAAEIEARAQADANDAMPGLEEPPEDGEVDENTAVAKVHVRGVDVLTTDHLRDYANEYAPDFFTNVQWIDDTSVNLVYDTEIAAAEALRAFSADDTESVDALQLRPAKRLLSYPDVVLQVRMAVESDVKVAGAKDRSRFYLVNPEWDPDMRLRKKRGHEERGNGDGYNKRHRRDIGDDLYARRQSRDNSESFDVNLYDDNPQSVAAVRAVPKRNDSHSSGGEGGSRDYGRRLLKFDDEDLFPSKAGSRLRNRSASPIRDGDGRFGFDDDQPQRRTARARSPTPPHLRKARANYAARDARRLELFPEKTAGGSMSITPLTNGHISPPKIRASSSNGTPKELFPDKATHRRHDARDLDAAEVTEAIGRYSLDGTFEQDTYTSRLLTGQRRPTFARVARGGDLFSRMTTAGPRVDSTHGRLLDQPIAATMSTAGNVTTNGEFSIRGAGGVSGKKEAAAGDFSILGASRDRIENPLVRELFPMKSGGGAEGGLASKDLFDGRIKGRGARRRAEDLF